MIKDEKFFAYASDFYMPCFTTNPIKMNSVFFVAGSNWIQYFNTAKKVLALVLKAGCCKGIDSREEKNKSKKERKSRTPLCKGMQAKRNLLGSAFCYLRIINL